MLEVVKEGFFKGSGALGAILIALLLLKGLKYLNRN
jgi:hypothetical protein